MSKSIDTTLRSTIYYEIKDIKTDFDNNSTTKVQNIFEKYKSTLELPTEATSPRALT